MTQDHDEPRAEALRGELDTADLRRRDDIARDADHEQIAETLIEDDLHRHTRVRAAENDGERLLARDEIVASRLAHECLETADARDKAAITVPQALERFSRGYHRRRILIDEMLRLARDAAPGRAAEAIIGCKDAEIKPCARAAAPRPHRRRYQRSRQGYFRITL